LAQVIAEDAKVTLNDQPATPETDLARPPQHVSPARVIEFIIIAVVVVFYLLRILGGFGLFGLWGLGLFGPGPRIGGDQWRSGGFGGGGGGGFGGFGGGSFGGGGAGGSW
jgi:uncharacterized protein